MSQAIVFEPTRSTELPDLNRRTALYRHYDAEDRLLYVGVAFDPGSRSKSHVNESDWIKDAVRFTGIWYATRAEALAAERKAIEEERPIHNRQHSLSRLPAPRRAGSAGVTVLSIRIDQAHHSKIEDMAKSAGTDVSGMVRRMLAYASANMPAGWVPPRGR